MADILAVARPLGVTLAAVALAVLSWMSAADRITAKSATPQGAYFGGAAATQLSFSRLARGDAESALAAARQAVRTAPVEAPAVSALASSLLSLGRSDRAYAAFSVAGVLGWRDVPTQLYWLAQAAAVGDVDVLAQRLDALLRLDIDNDAIATSLHFLGQSGLGQEALAMLLAENPPWERRFWLETGRLDGSDLEGRLGAIELAADRGASFDCEGVGIAAKRLIRNNLAAAAKRLWRRACERSGDALLSNGGFEIDPSATSDSPFAWQLQSEGGLDVGVTAAPPPLERHALRIRSSLTTRTIVARQLTALQPGRYRLSWAAALDSGQPDTSITLLVRCEGSAVLTADTPTSMTHEGVHSAAMFTVPGEGCPIQTVAIEKAASARGETQIGWVDDIGIESVQSVAAAAGS